MNIVPENDLFERNQSFLHVMNDIYNVSAICSTRTYIWGGFAIDIHEQRFLREHRDLDGFVDNMLNNLELLTDEYCKLGYTTEFNSNFKILVIKKDGLHAAFNQLDVDRKVAMWRHIGDHGTVFFPAEWLDLEPQLFYGVKAYTSGLKFEYGFRSIAGLLNPDWKYRDKDREAISLIKGRLEHDNIDLTEIHKSIWSYNPLWLDKGYSPFGPPTLVVPGIATEISQKKNVDETL